MAVTPILEEDEMPIWLAPMLITVAETALAAVTVRLIDAVFAEGEPVAEPTTE